MNTFRTLFILLTFGFIFSGCNDDSSSSASTGLTQYQVATGQFVFEPHNYYSPVTPPFKFNATFNANTSYTLAETNNHAQVSKLLGFTDCNDDVLTNSARFGWQVINGALSIFAFRQINGVITYEANAPMAVLAFGQSYYFEIDTGIDGSGNNIYTFIIKTAANGTLVATESHPRACSDGAKFINTPYFGGTQPAPHAMEIDVELL